MNCAVGRRCRSFIHRTTNAAVERPREECWSSSEAGARSAVGAAPASAAPSGSGLRQAVSESLRRPNRGRRERCAFHARRRHRCHDTIAAVEGGVDLRAGAGRREEGGRQRSRPPLVYGEHPRPSPRSGWRGFGGHGPLAAPSRGAGRACDAGGSRTRPRGWKRSSRTDRGRRPQPVVVRARPLRTRRLRFRLRVVRRPRPPVRRRSGGRLRQRRSGWVRAGHRSPREMSAS